MMIIFTPPHLMIITLFLLTLNLASVGLFLHARRYNDNMESRCSFNSTIH